MWILSRVIIIRINFFKCFAVLHVLILDSMSAPCIVHNVGMTIQWIQYVTTEYTITTVTVFLSGG